MIGKGKSSPSAPSLVYSTTIGRAKFAEFLQMTFGEKTVFGFDRYGRALGALVPMEAVKMLAGREVDPDVRRRIERSAQELLRQAPVEITVLEFAQGPQPKAQRSLLELEEIRARRARRVATVKKRRVRT